MIDLVEAIASMLVNQLKNIARFILGRPIILPSLGSMTLDRDDVELACRWLRDRSSWSDDNEVCLYESEFAAWNGSKHAFAFMGGRVALSACIQALELRSGDEVIIPGYTCVVVPNAFTYAGISIVFSDIELDTYGLDASILERNISSHTKAILVQHLYGLVCRDYEKIIEIARRHGLAVIEDCAHSTGAEYKGKKVGTYGDLAFYSSEQSKIFTTIQGGIAATDDATLAEKLREFQAEAPLPHLDRTTSLLYSVVLNYYQCKHPRRWITSDWAKLRFGRYRIASTTEQEERGVRPDHYGQRMAAPIAALARNQLTKIDSYNHRRRQGAFRWEKWCTEHGYVPPQVIVESTPVFLRYPVRVEPRMKHDRSWAVRDLKVNPGVWFVSQVHPKAVEIPNCPNAVKAVQECINFPTLFN